MVVRLSTTSEQTPSESGGKAHSLSILINHNFPVPGGFILTVSDYQSFLEENDVQGVINERLKNINKSNYKELATEIRDHIRQATFPPELRREVKEQLSELNTSAVSVRSSSVGEDGESSSFAGQHDSFLNIQTDIEEIIEKIKKCFASGFNDHAILYRLQQEEPLKNEMAVIVQQMIVADVAGTVFTADPDSGDRDKLIIESTWGLGEGVVSGTVTPDRFIVAKDECRILSRKQGSKEQAVRVSDEGIVVSETKEYNRASFSLEDETVKRITSIGKEIEALFGSPQDIEWCKSDGKIWILQSRPITTV